MGATATATAKLSPLTRTFDDPGTFEAFNAATRFLEARGFSVGSVQAGSPTGVVFGRRLVAKWKNIPLNQHALLHGAIQGDTRNGPVTVTIKPTAPADAIAAFLAEA